LDANKTIDNCREKAVLLGQEMGGPTSTSTPESSPLPTASSATPLLSLFAIDLPCSRVVREARLPLQHNTQNHSQREQSTILVLIDDAREEAVPQGQDKGSFRMRYHSTTRQQLGCLDAGNLSTLRRTLPNFS